MGSNIFSPPFQPKYWQVSKNSKWRISEKKKLSWNPNYAIGDIIVDHLLWWLRHLPLLYSLYIWRPTEYNRNHSVEINFSGYMLYQHADYWVIMVCNVDLGAGSQNVLSRCSIHYGPHAFPQSRSAWHAMHVLLGSDASFPASPAKVQEIQASLPATPSSCIKQHLSIPCTLSPAPAEAT